MLILPPENAFSIVHILQHHTMPMNPTEPVSLYVLPTISPTSLSKTSQVYPLTLI